MNKYHNVKIIYDGIKFDSKKEASRYAQLKLLEKNGYISDLKLQVRFEIVPKKNGNKRARYYVADFVYSEKNQKVIEDVKSYITKKNPVYSLKKALILANYPEYLFREID
jgi:ribosomal protein S8